MTKPVTIIVPVYGDWPSLKKCIESLNKYDDALVDKIILINDCGPEVNIIEANIKNEIKNIKKFEYYRNSENIGFIKTCNRAVFELDNTDNDILLLNSDTEVTSGYLNEMVAVLYEKDTISVVSPRSNNATLTTVPLVSAAQKGIGPKESYVLFKKFKDKFPRYNLTPVAHGFCMLIKRKTIDEFGLFDEVFGMGYGEEVDFCQRIRARHHQCAISNHAYVYHLESRSFTPERKQKLLERNNIIIWERYPEYRKEVQEYMQIHIRKEEKIYKGRLKFIFKKIVNLLRKNF